ncbi:hypothetical protein VTN31DRAFT_4928 [Thermomyces dupontii]|uniref:uncharacterized protein n=1 Tax=Talaromyces thermophilus TaxID=28565 RepID=UPI0037422DE3
MPTKIPQQSDFPSHVITIIHHPSNTTASSRPPSNILLLLHGLGDTAARFASFGRALNLPETVCVTVQAPNALPLGITDGDAFHWGDDLVFDSDGSLAMDAGGTNNNSTDGQRGKGFDKATKLLTRDVILDTLVERCGYRLREIMILGFGQGGMAALVAARELARVTSASSAGSSDDGSLAGIVSFGAPYPLSGSVVGMDKNRTPVLLLASRDDGHSAVTDSAVRRTKEVYEFVELHRWSRRGDGMPRNRDEMLPVMQFFARRLRSRQGVPEGSIELT